MKTKRLLIFIIALSLLVFTACGKETDEPESRENESRTSDEEEHGDDTVAMGGTGVITDEITYSKEYNVRLTVFRFGENYVAKVKGEDYWLELLNYSTTDIIMDDGEFAYITADITRASGGIMGYIGNPKIDKIIDEEYYSIKEAIDNDMLEEFDESSEYFDGPRVNGKHVIIYGRGEYYVYDEDGFTGKYDSIIEAKAAMGITVNIIFDSSNNEIDNMKLYIFRTGDYYLGYSNLGGYDFWQPILYTDFENDFSDIEIIDGSMLCIDDADVMKIDKDDIWYDNAIMVTAMDGVHFIDYSAFICTMPVESWEYVTEYNEYDIYTYNCGEYMISYYGGLFRVYTEGSDGRPYLFGTFDNPEYVSDVIGM